VLVVATSLMACSKKDDKVLDRDKFIGDWVVKDSINQNQSGVPTGSTKTYEISILEDKADESKVTIFNYSNGGGSPKGTIDQTLLTIDGSSSFETHKFQSDGRIEFNFSILNTGGNVFYHKGYATKK
jgi:hypothetical protein